MSERLKDLKGLGSASEKQLVAIGIRTRAELAAMGPIPTFLKLKQQYNSISLNFLYAIVGALNDEPWTKVAKTQRETLLMQLEGYKELDNLFNSPTDEK